MASSRPTRIAFCNNIGSKDPDLNQICGQVEGRLTSRFTGVEDRLDDIASCIRNLTLQFPATTESIDELKGELNELRQYSIRNVLRFYRLPELENEDVVKVVIKFVRATMNVLLIREDIDYAFRAGKLDHPEHPRPIIVGLVRHVKKMEILNCRKMLKETKFWVFESLTQSNHNLLLEAKKQLGKTKVSSMGGKIWWWNDAENKRIHITSGEMIPFLASSDE